MGDEREHFGQLLRRLRTARGLSLRALADLSHISKSKLNTFEMEDGRNVDPDDVAHLDEVLDAQGTLRRTAEQDRTVKALRVIRAVPFKVHRFTELAAGLLRDAEGADPMHRRTFLQGAGLAAAAASGLALEATRHGLQLTPAEERATATVQEWHEIVAEHGYGYMTTPPHDLLQALMIDLLAIQYAVDPDDRSDTAAELRGAAALLAVLAAMTLANLGQLREGRRWWRTARHLATDSGIPKVIMWVRGREVVRALYEQRPIGSILAMIDDAEPLVVTAPRESLPEFLTGKAQALALAGRTDQAGAALRQVQDLFTELPAGLTQGTGSTIFGWPEERVHFTRSFVHSHLGQYDDAADAQAAAIAAYPSEYARGPIQIELQRALCLVNIGEIDEGVRHAHKTLTTTAHADRIRPVIDLSHRVVAALPPTALRRPEVIAYRELLNTPYQLEV